MAQYQQPNSGAADAPDDALKGKAREVGRQATDQVGQQVQQQARSAADRIDRFADSVQAAARELEQGEDAGLSHYVSGLAGSLGEFAEGLRHKNADELMRDVRRMARQNPALFITGSVALGFGLTRLAKASGAHHGAEHHAGDRSGERADASARLGASASPGASASTVDGGWGGSADRPHDYALDSSGVANGGSTAQGRGTLGARPAPANPAAYTGSAAGAAESPYGSSARISSTSPQHNPATGAGDRTGIGAPGKGGKTS